MTVLGGLQMNDKEKKLLYDLTDALDIIFCHELQDELYDKEETKNYPYGIWFRGHECYNYKLLPKIYRFDIEDNKPKSEYYDESNIFSHFRLRHPEYHFSHRDTIDWLCLMQHYGLPTRLLDWTESILIALFFAVKDNHHTNDKDGTLIVLNANRLNRMLDLEISSANILNPQDIPILLRAEIASNYRLTDAIDKVEEYAKIANEQLSKLLGNLKKGKIDDLSDSFVRYPLAIFPNRLNARMIVQSGVFTIHGGKICENFQVNPKNCFFKRGANENDCLKEKCVTHPISLEKLNDEQDNKHKIIAHYKIPSERKETIRKQLRAIGIHDGTIFPELEYQANFVKEEWHYKKDIDDDVWTKYSSFRPKDCPIR